MCGRSRYFLPPAVALRLAITIIFNDSFFFIQLQLGNWRERKARKSGIDGVPANASRARRDLFCATSGRYLLITRKRFRIDNVDIADRSWDSCEYVAEYLYQKRISEEFWNVLYSVKIETATWLHNYLKIPGLFSNIDLMLIKSETFSCLTLLQY